MKILHINASDIGGGAARAAYRIHRSLVDHGAPLGLASQMRVISQLSDDPTVIGGPPQDQSAFWQRLHPRLNRQARRGFITANPTFHSIGWPATGLGRELQQRRRLGRADLLHLHWLGDGTLSIEEIGRLPQPLVWTLHDQWAFCGAEHYTSPPLPSETASSDERFTQGYSPASRPVHEAGPDLNRRTWLRKRHAWCRPGRQPIQIVCPSTWLAHCASRSTLMGEWPITVVPNPIDLNVWTPCEQGQARALLGLPADRPLVLFGAMGGTADPRKGADLLLEALQRLRTQVAGTPLQQLELVLFGQSRPVQPPDLGFPIHYTGRLHDDLSLRLLYAAADLFVIPSLQDNLPNTGLEAHACGTPVVAFRTGGLVDIVDEHVTGSMADPFDPASLAASIRWVLEDPQRRRQLAAAARARAERLWNPARVAGLYAELYREVLTTR
ncbi:glycosyltransferase [Synechococcus sp. CBW1006]|uniref:glycosyltransferase n=1 Tax=Synechococcus sp. CBW1006 TaxID=1353138 RepID=UPI0018CCE967|nr:glycosyltransferase [Synechococcus sp. CBW1006]QPN65916.1 glycosyltransferase [Synechococcus sp. CBW1006]